MKFSSARDGESTFAPSSVHGVLQSSGRPLDGATRAFMEPRFGRDFSRVRVHNDATAAATADSIGARAYTVGPHIAFASGQFETATRVGRQLLAHELAHVLQQTAGEGRAELSLARSIDERPQLQVSSSGPVVQMQARGSAGGCGVCLGGDSRAAGKIAHDEIQDAFKALDTEVHSELPVQVVKPGEKAPFVPELDLAKESYSNLFGRVIEIGEIKPLDDANTQLAVGRRQLGDYARELKFTYDEVFRLKSAPPSNIPFINPNNPPGCPPQIIEVQLTEPGIYQYYCEPPWSKLVTDPNCKCASGKQKEKKQQASVVKAVGKPEEKKTQPAATKGHLYVESVDPYFRELASHVPQREVAAGEKFIVAVNSDFYKQALAQKQAQEMERTRRTLSVDPRNVPILGITAPLIPIARLFGPLELGIAMVGLVALAVAAAPEEAAAGAGATAAAGGGTAVAATATGTAAAEGGQVISLTARIAARRAAAVTSEVITAAKAAAAAAALLYIGTSSKDAEAATKPYVGKRMLSMIKITGSGDQAKLGEEITVGGQSYTVIMGLGTVSKP